MLVCGGCSAITQESRCKKNWGACVTVADSLWDRQVFIQRIDVGLKCLGLLRFKRSSTEGRTHGLPRTLLVTTCCYTNLPFNPTPLQFFFDKLGSPWQLDPVHWAEAKCHGDPSLSKWGPNWDPKTEKGPHRNPGPQMGTHLATVPPHHITIKFHIKAEQWTLSVKLFSDHFDPTTPLHPKIGRKQFKSFSMFVSPESWEDGDLNLTLPGIAWVVFQNLDCNNFVCAFLPALGHLHETML